MNSRTDFTGSEGWTTSIVATSQHPPAAARSFNGSNGIFLCRLGLLARLVAAITTV